MTSDRDSDGRQARRSPLRATIRLHLIALPGWAIRVALDSMQPDQSIVFALIADASLLVIYWRANRTSDLAYPDWFGVTPSWTRFFYVPELLAWVNTAIDLWKALR